MRSGSRKGKVLAEQVLEIAKLIARYADKDRKPKSKKSRWDRIKEGFGENDVIANGSLNYLHTKLIEKSELMWEASDLFLQERQIEYLMKYVQV